MVQDQYSLFGLFSIFSPSLYSSFSALLVLSRASNMYVSLCVQPLAFVMHDYACQLLSPFGATLRHWCTLPPQIHLSLSICNVGLYFTPKDQIIVVCFFLLISFLADRPLRICFKYYVIL